MSSSLTVVDTDIENYVFIAFLVLMVYDHVLTFDKEVGWIWTLKWRLPKFLFLINRYAISPSILLTGIICFIFPAVFPVAVWNATQFSVPWVAVCSFAIAEAVLIVRACALYGQRKLFVRLLTGFFALEMISVIFITILLTLDAVPALKICPRTSCNFDSIYFILWMPFPVFDGIIMLLTLYKAFPFRGGRSPTASLLARDSIVYFVVLFSAMLINLFGTAFGFNFMLPAECIASISISRMMMNLRGLSMEDPDNTVHLRTLRFASNGSNNDLHHDTTSATFEIT